MPSTTYVATQPGPFAALLQASEMGGFVLDPLPPVRVHDVYLDSATGELLARGVALRARTLAGETTFTLRPIEGDGTTYEAAAEAGRPLEVPPGPLADAVGRLTDGEPLEAVLQLRQYRTPRIAYDRGRTVGLVSFDVVVYETDDGNVVANEVELELSRDADIERLDPTLQAHGLEPARRSKMERGLLRARRGLGQSVLLLPDERDALQAIRAAGTPEERRRAHVVLLDARGFSAQTIADQTGASRASVETVRRQFRSARMEAVRSGAEISGDAASPDAPAVPHPGVADFDSLDSLLEAFQSRPDETPILDGPPLASLDPVPEFVPTVGWERSAALQAPRPDEADAEWLPRAKPDADDAPAFAPIGDALVPHEDHTDGAPAREDSPPAEPPREPEPSGVAPRGGWVAAAAAPSAAPPDSAPRPAPTGSWLDAAVAAPGMASPEVAASAASPGPVPVAESPDPFADQAIARPAHARDVDADTPILEAAWLTIGHQVAAFEAATDALFRSGDARDARKLFLSAHRVRLALESFAAFLPDRAVERMTGALRRLVLTLDAAQDYDRAVEAGARHLEPVRDAHLESARRILEGGRQRAWGHRSRRLLGRLQSQGQEGLLIGDDFPAPPDDFIGEVGDRPVPSRLRHVVGSLVWRRYEDILAFEDDIERAVTPELAYHLATAVSGLHFVLGLAETERSQAVRDLARLLDQAESLAVAYRHQHRTAELTDAPPPGDPGADDVRKMWRLLASVEFRKRLAHVAVGV